MNKVLTYHSLIHSTITSEIGAPGSMIRLPSSYPDFHVLCDPENLRNLSVPQGLHM